MQVIKRRLADKEGSQRTRELRDILTKLPGYRNGPYADIRKWVESQIDETRTRSSVVHRDSISVRREGAAQVALVGPPNAGKSSLLQSLSHVQIKVGAYAFTTLRPVPALTRINGVLIQLVEIPGLIAGAARDRGGGRALLGVLRGADAIVYCHDASQPSSALRDVIDEVEAAGIDLPTALAATKADDASQNDLSRLRENFPSMSVVAVSVLDDASLEDFKAAIWGLTGLLRVYPRTRGRTDDDPVALRPGATIADVARALHKEMESSCTGGRVWGPSARFDGQIVGRSHPVAHGDVVEIRTAG